MNLANQRALAELFSEFSFSSAHVNSFECRHALNDHTLHLFRVFLEEERHKRGGTLRRPRLSR